MATEIHVLMDRLVNAGLDISRGITKLQRDLIDVNEAVNVFTAAFEALLPKVSGGQIVKGDGT